MIPIIAEIEGIITAGTAKEKAFLPTAKRFSFSKTENWRGRRVYLRNNTDRDGRS